MHTLELLRKIQQKTYYKFANLKIPYRKIVLPQKLKWQRNIFIYFDYEREFSGLCTEISDRDIFTLIRLLEECNLLSTWFTVGKIFEIYPESVNLLLNKGHEIGSHTFSHIPPLNVSSSILLDDFIKFRQAAKVFKAEITGFHSPCNRWSMRTIKYLRKFYFTYDVVHCKKKQKCMPIYLQRGKNSTIIRLYTLGDDWPVFKKQLSANEVSDYFMELLSRINKGDIAGIGFHPWVIFSDKNIFDGFRSFLKHLALSDEYCIKPAKEFVNAITELNN